jgi:hypothetical protein
LIAANPINRVDPSGLQTATTTQGTFVWNLNVRNRTTVDFNITFKQNKSVCKHNNITFIQVVLGNITGGTRNYAGLPIAPGVTSQQAYYQQFETASGARVDHQERETDPYYGAVWHYTEWIPEDKSSIGSFNSTTSAYTQDGPHVTNARSRLGPTMLAFETVAVSTDGTIFGGVMWGFVVPDYSGSEIKLMGGTVADFSETPSTDWFNAVDKWNAIAKPKLGWSTFPDTPRYYYGG